MASKEEDKEETSAIVEMADGDSVPPCATRRRASFAHSDIIKYRRSFDGYDFNKDGTVRASDLDSIVNKLGYRMTKEQVQDILINNELDENAFVSFEKFLDIIPRNYEQIPEEEHKLADLREKFQRYDLDDNGVISLQEAQWSLQVELKVTPQTALRLLNQFIKLDYNQFVEFYKQVQEK
jgi:Ca2+-binding EF-hand superfamily protein